MLLVTCLPNYIHAIVDHKRHGIGFAVVLDNLRDIACHAGDVFRVGVLGSQLDERCTPRNASSITPVIVRLLQSCGPTTK